MSARLQTLLQFYEMDPDDAFTRFALAREYQKEGRPDEALRFFEGLAEDQPGYIGTYYHLGKLYEDLGRTPEAVAAYREGITRAREAFDAHALAELQDALLQAEGFGDE